ncbi:MAG: hypothetical protein H7141_00815 [Burkholderiales bacterium]|nr:hypothetical protein [Bacteroidia bacterium]
MAEAKYIPTTDAAKAVWLNNFSAKLIVYGTQLGVSNAEISNLQKDNAAYQYVINLLEQYRQSVLHLTGYKNIMKHSVGQQHISVIPLILTPPAPPPSVPEGIFDRATKLASRIKASLNYSINIGNDLGITSSILKTDVDSMQPKLKIKINVGRPHIKWTKGDADATDLYVNRNDGLGFVLIGRFTRSEYMDLTALTQGKLYDEWNYKAIFVVADKLVGLYSDVVSVDVKRM